MDSRLLSGFSLQVEKASLMGQSSLAYKDADGVLDANTPLVERRSPLRTRNVASGMSILARRHFLVVTCDKSGHHSLSDDLRLKMVVFSG